MHSTPIQVPLGAHRKHHSEVSLATVQLFKRKILAL